MTSPKVKDLVHIPTEKYEAIYQVLQNKNKIKDTGKDTTNDTGNDTIKELKKEEMLDVSLLLPKPDNPDSMKEELKNFLKKQRNSTF